jgi:hypothetical protein
LIKKEARWEFWFPPVEEKNTNDDSEPVSSIVNEKESQSQLSLLEEAIDQSSVSQIEVDDLASEEPSISFKPPKSKELVIDSLNREELERVLKNLYRRSSSDYEERGVRILYLAFRMEKRTS